MSTSQAHEVRFDGVRLRFDSTKTFDAVVEALLDDVGRAPVPINDFAKRFDSWDSYADEVASHVGPGGFMLFGLFDHSSWLTKTGIEQKVLRVVIGNPLIAITMIRHDVTAGLFAPVELLITEEAGGSAVTYVVPSSLMVVAPNPPLLAAALELDAKLQALVARITGPA
jgi:hypothetical protein